MAYSNKQLEHIRNRGIQGDLVEEPITDAQGNPVYDKDGKPLVRHTFIVTHMPDNEYEINKFFSESTPCWFPGCEELRKKYNNELMALQASGRRCSNCDRGKLYRKYYPMVQEAINLYGQNKNSGTEQVSGSGSKSTGRASKSASLLRRAGAGIKALFKIGKGTGG